MEDPNLDVIGYWTEIKLRILKDYSKAYATILSKQSAIKHFAYIDGYAGAGQHISKTTGNIVKGSPKVALETKPQFDHYHFIDMDGNRTKQLQELSKNHTNVSVYNGDCNSILIDEVFPLCRFENYRRALCLLDPYKLNPTWQVVETAGKMQSIEIFLNFMIVDANRNVLWRNPERVSKKQIQRMNEFWGDDSWREASYTKQQGLFEELEEKKSNEAIAKAYRKRLIKIAGFKYVPEPIPMRTEKGAIIYYLFFASHNKNGSKIANAVFKKYRNMGNIHGN